MRSGARVRGFGVVCSRHTLIDWRAEFLIRHTRPADTERGHDSGRAGLLGKPVVARLASEWRCWMAK